jgi:hypothetical protein
MNGQNYAASRIGLPYKREPLSNPSAFGIVQALVKFNNWLFQYSALDNEGIDEYPPGTLPEDGIERIRSLVGKVKVRTFAGTPPLSITGEVDPQAIPSYPSITVSAQSCYYEYDSGVITVQLFVGTYDQDKNQESWIDLINILDILSLVYFYCDPIEGVGGLASGDKEVRPLTWERVGGNTYPYSFAMMTVQLNIATPTNLNVRPLIGPYP